MPNLDDNSWSAIVCSWKIQKQTDMVGVTTIDLLNTLPLAQMLLHIFYFQNSSPPTPTPQTSQKCVFPLAPTAECLSYTVQNDVCAETLEGCFHIHWGCKFSPRSQIIRLWEAGLQAWFMTWQMFWKPILVQSLANKSVRRTLETSTSYTLKRGFTVKQETSRVQHLNL